MPIEQCIQNASFCCTAATVMLFVLVPLLVIALMCVIRSPLFPRRRPGIPSYAMAYHSYLVAEYHAVLKAQPDPQDKDQRVEAIANETNPKKLEWDDLFVLELWIQNRLNSEELERKAWLVRRRYEVISGKTAFHAYQSSRPPDPSVQGGGASHLARLRADLGFVLQDTYWLYQIRNAWGEGRDLITMTIGLFLMITTLALVVIAIARANSCPTPGGVGILVIYESVMMGAMGGLVSLWRRLQRAPSADRRLDSVLEFEHGRQTIMFQSFISGAIFAFTLLLLFASGVAQGPLFPAISLSDDPVPLLEALRLVSQDGVTLAKLLAWSFVAGFAERFVPDFLDRLTRYRFRHSGAWKE